MRAGGYHYSLFHYFYLNIILSCTIWTFPEHTKDRMLTWWLNWACAVPNSDNHSQNRRPPTANFISVWKLRNAWENAQMDSRNMHGCAKVAYVATDDCQPWGSLRANYRRVTFNCALFHATRDVQTEVKLAVNSMRAGDQKQVFNYTT